MKYFILLITLLTLTISTKAQDTTKVKSTEPILDFCDTQPQFPGGPDAMAAYVQANVTYPEESKKRNEEGTVYAQFVVNLDGTISDIVILKGVSPLLDAEAIRVIKSMPHWTPGAQQGKPVRVRYVVPIHFVIQDSKSKGNDKKKEKSKEQLIIIEP